LYRTLITSFSKSVCWIVWKLYHLSNCMSISSSVCLKIF
jgi:hypothetical protein